MNSKHLRSSGSRLLLAALLLVFTAGQASAQIACLTGSLSTGVMAFYPFGSGSLNDVSGGGHNLSNPTLAYPTTDRFGSPQCAYHFDQVNGDFLNLSAVGSTFLDNITTAPFSISLWYQPMGPRSAGAYELLMGRGPTSGLHCPDTWGEWSVGLYDCRKAVMGFDMYNTWQTTTMTCTGFQTFVTGNWHHLAFVWDGVNRNLYVDGILYSSAGGPCGAMSGNVGSLMLGVDYTGDLDDIIIYNRALAPSEVTSLQYAGTCCASAVVPPTTCNPLPGSLSTGLMAFYPFGHGSLLDNSGNGHHLGNPTTAYPTFDRFMNPTCAYHFDQVNNDYLNIPFGAGTTWIDNMTTSPFSISLWYRPTGSRSVAAYELLVGRNNTPVHCPDTYGEWSVGLYDCRKAVVAYDMYSQWQTSGSIPCPTFMSSVTGVWHHLTFVYDGINRYLWVDGTMYPALSGPCGSPAANVGDFLLGKDYTGDLDEVVMYNRALTASEVYSLDTITSVCCDTPKKILPCTTLAGSLSTGVLAFYPFGNGSLLDLGGGGHDLTNPTSAYPTVDRSGNPTCAYHFDQVNSDFLFVNPSSGGGSTFLDNLTTSPFSISLWYQPMGPRASGAYELLMGRGPTSGLHCPDTWGEWSVGLYDCRKAVVGYDMYNTWQTSSMTCSGFQSWVTGNWHHLVFIWDGINRNLFVDGILYSSAGGPCGALSGNIGDLMLGVDYTGDLDDIIIYNRVLTAAEVTALGQMPGSCCDGILSSAKHAPTDTRNTVKLPAGTKEVRVFPNPSDGQVFVSAGTSVIRNVSVYSNSGALVGTYRIDAMEGSVNLDNLASGVYFIRVTTDTETTVHKVIKN